MDGERDGSIHTLSRVDHVFINLPMAELRDFRCQNHSVRSIGDRSVPSDHIPVRLAIECASPKQQDHPVIQRWLAKHPSFVSAPDEEDRNMIRILLAQVVFEWFHFDHRLRFFSPSPRFVSWILCAFRNRSLSRRPFFPISHRAHQQMSESLISRLMHKHRLFQFPIHALLALPVLIFTCVLPYVTKQAIASRAQACPPAPHLSRLSFVICPLVRMSKQFAHLTSALPACRPMCRSKSLISLLSLPPQPNGCTSSKRDQMRLTRLLPTSAQTWLP